MAVFAVRTAKGANWDWSRGNREQALWEEHAAFADGLVERGVIIIGGPIGSDDAEDIALLAVECADESEVRSVFESDPWTVHGVFRLKDVRPWTLWLDGRDRVARLARHAEADGRLREPLQARAGEQVAGRDGRRVGGYQVEHG